MKISSYTVMRLLAMLNYLTGLFEFFFLMDETSNLRFGQHQELTVLRLCHRFGDCPEVGAPDSEWLEWLTWRQTQRDGVNATA